MKLDGAGSLHTVNVFRVNDHHAVVGVKEGNRAFAEFGDRREREMKV